MKLSIIVPTVNETANIDSLLASLQGCRAQGCEVIVVDGGSSDDTLERALSLADRVLSSTRGRATQMNAGAALASGDVLLFLHADSRLPANAAQDIAAIAQQHTEFWGRFDVRIASRLRTLIVVSALMNLRSRLTGIATGDQGIFVARALFDRAGGFPMQPLMEDIELSRHLRAVVWPHCLRARIATSGRRWEKNGALRTIVLMWKLRWAYFRGADPASLVRRYEV